MPAFFFERNKYRDAFTIKFVFPKRRCFGYLELLEEEEEEEEKKTCLVGVTVIVIVLFLFFGVIVIVLFFVCLFVCFSTPSLLNPTSFSSNASPSNAYYLAEPLNPGSSITPSLSLDSSSPT
jgi:hypothetical protein